MLLLLFPFPCIVEKKKSDVNGFKIYTPYCSYFIITLRDNCTFFVFIVICCLTSSLAIFHAYCGETSYSFHIEIKQGIIQHSLDII